MRQLVALLFAGLAATGTVLAANTPAPPKGIMVLDGRPAPALALKSMEGKAVDLQTLRGRWVMVHFWASWCGPCRREMPTVGQLKQVLTDKPFDILLVNTAEDEDTVFSFLGQVAPDLDSLLDPDGRVTDQWQPRGLPASFFVDPEGRLRWLALGGRPWDKPAYRDFVTGLVQSSPARK